jgi:DNA-binding transcriptional MerR regulator
MNKKKLLTIGELSKYTGASKKSLRYYEQIGILKPVYIDPDTSYRYYSTSQTTLVGLIMFCIELDIPLKKLPSFIHSEKGQDAVDLKSFLAHGEEEARKK